MADVNLEKFSSPDFDSDRYVKELARSCVGGEELQHQKIKIKTLCEEAAKALKKNVYENHMQFIDTATEISHLEAEMYKLSHLLSDQRSIINTLSLTSILGNDNIISQDSENGLIETDKEEELRKNKLNNIMEKVENCKNLLESPSRMLIHEGDLLEIEPEENTAQKSRMHAYLFNDCLMLTTWIANRRGHMRYRYESNYPISTLAVVNVRDHDNVKQAIKLLAFPDTRMFQCNSFNSKKDWLEKFDVAKKKYLENEDKKLKKDSYDIPRQESVETPSIGPDEIKFEHATIPDWLTDVPEELDVLIVERHFLQAYELMVKAKTQLDYYEYKEHPFRNEIIKKIDVKKKNLIEILMKELNVDLDWSPRGGLSSVRYAISILNKFNMTSQACDRFLSICSQTVKIHMKGVQLEGSIVNYVKHVGEVFFCTLSDALTEFKTLFPKSKLSTFIVWASTELRTLINQVVKQIFTPQSTLESTSECVKCLREQVNLFCEFGLDLRFQLDTSLRSSIMKCLKEYCDKTVDSMKSKLLEDKWQPSNFHTKAGCNKFLNQMESLGLILDKYVINETWIDLSSSTIWFTYCIITLQTVGIKLVTRDMMDVLDDCIFTVFNARLMLSIGNDSSYTQKNFKFILDKVLPYMLKHYNDEVGYQNEKLLSLAKKFGVAASTPKKSSIKYTDEEFL